MKSGLQASGAGYPGSVYKHLDTTLEWLGVKNYNTRKKTVKDIALHGAREARGEYQILQILGPLHTKNWCVLVTPKPLRKCLNLGRPDLIADV